MDMLADTRINDSDRLELLRRVLDPGSVFRKTVSTSPLVILATAPGPDCQGIPGLYGPISRFGIYCRHLQWPIRSAVLHWYIHRYRGFMLDICDWFPAVIETEIEQLPAFVARNSRARAILRLALAGISTGSRDDPDDGMRTELLETSVQADDTIVQESVDVPDVPDAVAAEADPVTGTYALKTTGALKESMDRLFSQILARRAGHNG